MQRTLVRPPLGVAIREPPLSKHRRGDWRQTRHQREMERQVAVLCPTPVKIASVGRTIIARSTIDQRIVNTICPMRLSRSRGAARPALQSPLVVRPLRPVRLGLHRRPLGGHAVEPAPAPVLDPDARTLLTGLIVFAIYWLQKYPCSAGDWIDWARTRTPATPTSAPCGARTTQRRRHPLP